MLVGHQLHEGFEVLAGHLQVCTFDAAECETDGLQQCGKVSLLHSSDIQDGRGRLAEDVACVWGETSVAESQTEPAAIVLQYLHHALGKGAISQGRGQYHREGG